MEWHLGNGLICFIVISFYAFIFISNFLAWNKIIFCLYLHFRYYEFEVITAEFMKVGWAKLSLDPSTELGVDGNSYAFDGFGVCILCFVYYSFFFTLIIIAWRINWCSLIISCLFREENGTMEQNLMENSGGVEMSSDVCWTWTTKP